MSQRTSVDGHEIAANEPQSLTLASAHSAHEAAMIEIHSHHETIAIARAVPSRQTTNVVLMVLACAALTGCGLVAAPCRVASAGLKIVLFVGNVAAAPTDGCAEVIDP